MFSVSTDQQTADLVAFLLCFSGSDFPDIDDDGDPNNNVLASPGTASLDTHSLVGAQVTRTDGSAPAGLVNDMIAQADAGAVGLVVKGRQGTDQRGYAYVGSGMFQSDRCTEMLTTAQILAAAGPGEELTFTTVPTGTQTRIGIDRDEDGAFDQDEIDAGTDPTDPTSSPPSGPPAAPSGVVATANGQTAMNVTWVDNSSGETGFAVERRQLPSGTFAQIASLPADTSSYPDSGLTCETSYEYRISAFGCGGTSPGAVGSGTTAACPGVVVAHVQDIVVSVASLGRNTVQAAGTVLVVDAVGNPVPNATVFASWSGSVSAAQTAVTDASGTAVFTSPSKKGKKHCFVLTVTNIAATGVTYDPAANVETSDSAGNDC